MRPQEIPYCPLLTIRGSPHGVVLYPSRSRRSSPMSRHAYPTCISLNRYLLGRGWQRDEDSSEMCWLYPRAFGGVPIQLDREDLEWEELAELGPSRPTVYLCENDIVVFSHGTWRGCPAHGEVRYQFRRGEAGAMAAFAARIVQVEQSSMVAVPAPFHRCLLSGSCGAWFRGWKREGGAWRDAYRENK